MALFAFNQFSNFIKIARNSTAIAFGVLAMGVTSATAQNDNLGAVEFEISCNQDANAAFELGLTLLHHMMYLQADSIFTSATEITPDCAMLYWGIAMSKFHPLWPGQPSQDTIAAGRQAAMTATSLNAKTDIERAFVNTVLAFYVAPEMSFDDRESALVEGSQTLTEMPEMSYRDRLNAWAAAQADMYGEFSDNVDASVFYALSQITTAPRGAAGSERRRQVGELLETLLVNAPQHPGVFHYAIHAYDTPALAEKALPFARGYGLIAPDVPHALHMPTHIFVRLGHWDDTIAWNERSAAAALAQPNGGVISSHFAHAMDYRIYAHLQRGEFDVAQILLDEFLSVGNQQDNFGTAYALAASPARVLLEQDLWSEAAAMPTEMHLAITWEKFPQCVAMLWFAKSIGAARSGDMSGAATALEQLTALHTKMVAGGPPYWAQLTEAQILSVKAWIALGAGDNDQAVTLQQQAADIEDTLGKSPVTPGHILPARELLGDMYTELGETTLAVTAYEATLSQSPNRRRSLRTLD